MTLSEAFRTGIQILKNADINAPATDAGVLLCSVVKCSREDLYVHGERELDAGLFKMYLNVLEKRSQGYPLQYLTGVQEFMSLPFYVGPGVLIPRQETELLVEVVLEFCRNKAGSYRNDADCINETGKGSHDTGNCGRILDMGTGSGCIAVSMAYYLPGWNVLAVDKMEAALDMVKKNAKVNCVGDRVFPLKSDLFRNVDMTACSCGGFDVIVSNPPYIRSADICTLQREVWEHEPVEALDGGIDGLFFYREIIGSAPAYLKEGGMLAFEVGYDQAEDVAKLMACATGTSGDAGTSGASGTSGGENDPPACFGNIKIHKDLAGIDRVVTGILLRDRSPVP